ncbi:MAG: FecR domain-containing protein [Myxococcales bacterium]|nr:FecR domain-containing protein [Myxococcales bacterium]
MRWVWALALILAACGEDPVPTPPVDPPPEDVGDPAADDGHATQPDPAPGRLVRLTGAVTIGGAEASANMEIDGEVPIAVPDGGQAVIQLRDGGRLEIDGEATARLVEDAAAQVILVTGFLYAVQPPAGNAPRPPLRVATPAVTVEIGQSGEIYVAAMGPTGAAWVSVLEGAAEVSVGEADNRRRVRTVELPAERAVAVPRRIAEPTEGPSRLTVAREAARVLAAGATEEPDEAADRATLTTETERLDQALRWLETEARRGRDLTAQHRDAVQNGRTEDATRLQRELVTHSQELYRLRRLATTRWERVRAEHLRQQVMGTASPTEDPVALRRDRVDGLLGQ